MYVHYKLMYQTVKTLDAEVRWPLGCTRMDQHKDTAEITTEMTEELS